MAGSCSIRILSDYLSGVIDSSEPGGTAPREVEEREAAIAIQETLRCTIDNLREGT